jgi:hypothetical protein
MVEVTVGISWPSQFDMPIDLKPRHSKILQKLLGVAYQAKSLGILGCDGRAMPTFDPTILRMATIGKLEAKL